MKTIDLLAIGALGVGAYFLFTKSASASNDVAIPAYVQAENQPQTFTTVTPDQKVKSYTFSTVKEGVAQLNEAWASGSMIMPVSQTLGTGYSANIGGETYTGNIAILPGQTEPKFIGVKSVSSSASSAKSASTTKTSYIPSGVTVKSVAKKDSIAYKKGYIK